ncbi:MAG TPA: FkbM family methyltransferase [Nitrospiraceae bacterium]|nr:FkbM family methyltransferase [Nitrospiraceae bacterium]
MLPILGSVARAARAAGLGSLLGTIRDTVDTAFSQMRTPPLSLRMGEITLHGFLRHRSFLESVAEGHGALSRQLFVDSLKPGMVVVDGGAHIGLYSLLASQRVGDRGVVIAFEPDPYNYRALAFNIKENRCRNVVILPKALSSTVGKQRFYQHPSTISSSFVDREDLERGRPREVDITALDNELDGLPGDPMLIKLDVEGAELLALRGMRNLLGRGMCSVILLELHPTILRQSGNRPEEVFRELERYRFSMQMIDEETQTLVPVTSTAALPKANFYCRRGIE